jgi:hypothetical protein
MNENFEQAAPSRRAAPQPAKKPAKLDRSTAALLLVAAFVAIGGIGFAAGHVTAQGGTAAASSAAGGRGFGFARPSLAPGQTFNTSQFGGGAGAVAGGISGTVQAVNGSTMTIQEANGTSVTIDLSGATTYHSAAAASPSDVSVGATVTVQIDTSALASQTPNPSASGALGGRTLTAKDVLVTQP